MKFNRGVFVSLACPPLPPGVKGGRRSGVGFYDRAVVFFLACRKECFYWRSKWKKAIARFGHAWLEGGVRGEISVGCLTV